MFAFSQAMMFRRSSIWVQIQVVINGSVVLFSNLSYFSNLIYSAISLAYSVITTIPFSSRIPRNLVIFSSVSAEFLNSFTVSSLQPIDIITSIRYFLIRFRVSNDFSYWDFRIAFFFSSSRIFYLRSIFFFLFSVSYVAPWVL